MDILTNHAWIIDWLLSHSIPEDFIPYNILLVLTVLFGLTIWYASRSLKQLRYNEYELKQDNQKLDRQVERDKKRIAELTEQVQELTQDVSTDEVTHPS